MWKKIILTISIAVMVGGSLVFAEPVDQFQSLGRLNHTLREAIIQHEPEQALDALEQLKQGVLAADLSKVGSVRGVRMLLDSLDQLDEQLHAVKPDMAQMGQLGTRVYFAVDALTHKGQPAWLTVEQTMRKHLDEWRSAARKQASSAARQHWVAVWQTWRQIEPAAWMRTPAPAMGEVQAWLQATNRAMRGKLNYTTLAALIRHEKSAIDGLFHHAQPTLQATTTTSANAGLGWQQSASIAAVVISALAAVAIYTRRKPYSTRAIPTSTK